MIKCDPRRRTCRTIAFKTKAQTPLVQFVVDLSYNKLYSKSTANPQLFYKSTTNRQLFDKSTTNPQHLDMSRCFGFVVDSTANPQLIETVITFKCKLMYMSMTVQAN
jgi:hypothetical protein